MTRRRGKGGSLEQLRAELVKTAPASTPEAERVVGGEEDRPRPRPANRTLTPEEQRQVAELARGRLVRSPSEQEEWRRRKTYPTGTLFLDRQGDEKCRCGERWYCKVHLHRRHQEPYVRELRD